MNVDTKPLPTEQVKHKFIKNIDTRKKYVLTISETFPQTHNRKGEPTNFIDSMLALGKIHTIRANFPLWEKRIEQINAGTARLSVRVWTGKPYRSKQKERFSFSGVGIQKLKSINFDKGFAFYIGENQHVVPLSIETLAKNDGLSLEDFREWFKDYDHNEPMAILHFTNSLYFQWP